MSDIRPGKLSQFRPAAKNANKHTPRGLKLLGDAMSEVGYVAPITVAADGEALDGSARLETAFEKFGDEAIIVHHSGTKPIVMVRDDIPNAGTPEAKKIAYGANQIASVDLSWDALQLAADLEAGLDLTGLFDPAELSEILERVGTELLKGKQDPGPQINKADELRQKWGVELGQLWALGKHRLIVGDCTDRATVERVMGGDRADACITDPPYGVDKAEWDGLFPDVWGGVSDFLDDGASLLIFPGVADLPKKISIISAVFDYQWVIPWYKPNAMQFGKTGFSVMDLIWWYSKGQPGVRPNTRDVIVDAIVPSKNDFGHPSPKQIGVMVELVDNYTNIGAIIFDPFLGSGTTLIACENLGRVCRAVEIDPGYVAVSLQRWADLTGKTPALLAKVTNG